MTASVGVGMALLCLVGATNVDEAQRWGNEAAQRGATPQQLAEAWERFEREQDRMVQKVWSGGAA